MIPTRPATRDDFFIEHDGKPAPVCVAFYYELKFYRFIGCGFRRPRKVRGQWVVRKWNDRPLLVRTDRETEHPDFVVAS